MTLFSQTVSAILLAGGQGIRMGVATPKQYLPLDGKPLALHSFEALTSCPAIQEVIVVCAPQYRSLFPHARFAKPGKKRQDSVANGFKEINPEAHLVLIHDAARPLITQQDLLKVIEAGKTHGAATLASPVKKTIKKADDRGFVTETLDRDTLFEIDTPQVLLPSLLEEGLKKQAPVTDDVSFAEILGHKVKLVMGNPCNVKVTTPEDLDLAATCLLRLREETHFAQI